MEKKGVVFVEEKPTWISEANIDLIKKPKFNRLMSFYVINTPDARKSVRGKSIEEYNFEESELVDLIKKDIQFWESSGNGSIVMNRFVKSELDCFPPTADFTERVCFSYTKNAEITCFFGHIRNSLAHGRFNITGSKKNPIMVLEDRNSEGNCSARIVLSLNTMIRWIDAFEKHMI